MEELNLENKKSLLNNPEYFGSYLNMARLNIYNINNHLAKKFEIFELLNEENITESFLTNKNNIKFKNKFGSYFFLTLYLHQKNRK